MQNREAPLMLAAPKTERGKIGVVLAHMSVEAGQK